MKPSIGRIVHYRLSEQNANEINRRREDASGNMMAHKQNGNGVIIHAGNPVSAGDIYPMVIVRTWGPDEHHAVNGQLLLDGNDTLWLTSVGQVSAGAEPSHGQWFEPPRV